MATGIQNRLSEIIHEIIKFGSESILTAMVLADRGATGPDEEAQSVYLGACQQQCRTNTSIEDTAAHPDWDKYHHPYSMRDFYR